MTLAVRPKTYISENRQERSTLFNEQVLTMHVSDLHICVRRDHDSWIAVEGTTGMFGEGDDQESALNDLVQSLYALRDDLRADRSRLAEHLIAQLQALEGSLST